MRHPMAKTHLASCRHEAAHTIVGEYFGARILWVQAPKLKHRGARGVGITQYGDCRRLGPVSLWVIMAAGSTAEYLWHGTPKGLISAGDFEDMVNTGLKGADFKIVWNEALRLTKRLKGPIWLLARRLANGKRLKRKRPKGVWVR